MLKPTTRSSNLARAKSLEPHSKLLLAKKQKLAVKLTDSIKTPYIASFRGPILLTAPHSSRVMRGGVLTKTKERIHLREHWVSTLALRLALEIERRAPPSKESQPLRASFMIWHKGKKFSKTDLDPNYLVKAQFGNSYFHQAIHKFVESQSGGSKTRNLQGGSIFKVD